MNNHNSLLSIATNQFTSFCMDNKSRQSAIFVSVEVSNFEVKRLFFVYFILYYIKLGHLRDAAAHSVDSDIF